MFVTANEIRVPTIFTVRMRQTIEKSAKPNSAKLVFLKPGRGAKQAKGPNDLQNLTQSRSDNFFVPNQVGKKCNFLLLSKICYVLGTTFVH